MATSSSISHYPAIVVFPIGPSEPVEYAADTISSIEHFFGPDHKVVLDDNSRKDTGARLKALFPNIDVVAGDYSGLYGRLFCNIGKAIQHACDHYTFDVLLRMDADALIIGPRPQDDAIAYFKQNPTMGIAGGYEFNYREERVYQGVQGWWPQNAWVALEAFNPLSLLLPNWYGHFFLQLVLRAMQHGYVIGQQVNGGAYFFQYDCAMAIRRAGWLTHPKLERLALSEDQIMSMLTFAVGMKIGNFSQGSAPLAVEWGSLPASPEELLRRNKKVTHSVKKWQTMTQSEVRAYFAASRGEHFPHEGLAV